MSHLEDKTYKKCRQILKQNINALSHTALSFIMEVVREVYAEPSEMWYV